MENSFKDGYNFFKNNCSTIVGTELSSQYIDEISSKINYMTQILNDQFKNSKIGSKQLKGNFAEFWHAETFNINAAANHSKDQARVLQSNGFGSVDIALDSGIEYGLKYYSSPAKTLNQQMKNYEDYYNSTDYNMSYEEFLKKHNITNPYDQVYRDQFRLVSSDQLEECIKLLDRKIAKESFSRPELVASYKDTRDKLCEIIKNDEGVKSISLSKSDAEILVEIAKQGKITNETLENLGVSLKEIVSTKNIFNQAMKSGLNTAALTLALEIIPTIISAIQFVYLDSSQKTKQEFIKKGLDAVGSSSEAFILGSISSALTTSCLSGKLGKTASNIDSTVIAAIAIMSYATIKESFSLVKKEITPSEFATNCAINLVTTTSGLIAGSVGQSIIPIPIIGYLIGNFIGVSISSVICNRIKKSFYSFSLKGNLLNFVEVEQDYTLPDEVFRELGLDAFEFDNFEYDTFEVDEATFDNFDFDTFEFDNFEIKFLRRGIIGVNKVGYIY